MTHDVIFLETSLGEFLTKNLKVISCRSPGRISGRTTEKIPGAIDEGIPEEISEITRGISRTLPGEISYA